MYLEVNARLTKGAWRDFRPPFFHYSNPSGPLINLLKHFCNRLVSISPRSLILKFKFLTKTIFNIMLFFSPTWPWSPCWATLLASACYRFIPTSQGLEPGPSIYLYEMKTALLKVAQGAELTKFFVCRTALSETGVRSGSNA